jgi:4-hydroxy 2-oxovalerate aldolase
MLSSELYDENDILSVIRHLKTKHGAIYSSEKLEEALEHYNIEPQGRWIPSEVMKGRDVLIIAPGKSIQEYRDEIVNFIESKSPYVIAFNAHHVLPEQYIDIRVACHPLRILADINYYLTCNEKLVTPLSVLPIDVQQRLEGSNVYDFGLSVQRDKFEFGNKYVISPSSLVVSYALGVATSGQAKSIMLAGFDGYNQGDPRHNEINNIFKNYLAADDARELLAITPTLYEIPKTSVYAVNI